MKSKALKKGFVFLFLLIFAIAGTGIVVSLVNPEPAYGMPIPVPLPGKLGSFYGFPTCRCPDLSLSCACIITIPI